MKLQKFYLSPAEQKAPAVGAPARHPDLRSDVLVRSRGV